MISLVMPQEDRNPLIDLVGIITLSLSLCCGWGGEEREYEVKEDGGEVENEGVKVKEEAVRVGIRYESQDEC